MRLLQVSCGMKRMYCLCCHWFIYQHLPSAYWVGGTGGCGCVGRSQPWLGDGTAVPEEVSGAAMCGRSAGCPGPQKAVATVP